jgi:hypothetical protein
MFVNKYKDDINRANLRKVSDEPKIKKQDDAYTQFASNAVYSRFATNDSPNVSDPPNAGLSDDDTKKQLLSYFPYVDISISQRYKIFTIIIVVLIVAIICVI